MKLVFSLLLLTALLYLSLSVYFNQKVERIVPCTTDSDCHEKNPGVCKDSEPYCL